MKGIDITIMDAINEDDDDADWLAEIGSPMDCERCKVTRDTLGGAA
jgi:hypothetical protein